MPSPTREVATALSGQPCFWLAPPGEPTVVGGVVQFRPPNGGSTESAALSALGASESVTLDSSRRTLTAPGLTPADWDGLSGPTFGRAALCVDNGPVLPVRIVRASGTTVYLADEVPVESGATGTLVSSVYRATIPTAVTSSTLRGWTWLVLYTLDAGAGLGGSVPLSERGTLHVVPRPFDTGCATEDVAAYLPHAIAARAGRELDHATAISLAGETLRRRLEQWAAGQSHYVDELAGDAFRDVHAQMAASRLVMGRAALLGDEVLPVVEALDAAAEAALDRVLTGWVWVDEDADGNVDETETQVRRRAGVGGTFTNSWRSNLATSTDYTTSTPGRER